MATPVKDPLVEMIAVEDMIASGEEVGLTNPDIALPITFRPKVLAMADGKIGLDVPAKFWKIVDVQKGMQVQITKLTSSHMFYMEGEILSIDQGKYPNLVVGYPTHILCAQRRLFYRFQLKKKISLGTICLPDGNVVEKLEAGLENMSPAGIGFHSKLSLGPGTRCEVVDMFDSTIPIKEGMDFFLEIVWCDGNDAQGYRCGGLFKFPTECEPDSFGRVLSQLQINRLAWYYHTMFNGNKSLN
jgi:c-di-GMP-binding flagellar brake protein YcgR